MFKKDKGAGKKAKADAKADLPKDLRLEPDYITVPGQNFALVSFVGGNCRQKLATGNDRLGMKIRGVFATREDAKAHAEKLQRSGDKWVDIYTVDMYNWCLMPPDPHQIEDVHYQETYLDNLMRGYWSSQQAAKEHFEERKRDVMTKGLPGPSGDAGDGDDVGAALEREDPWLRRKEACDAKGKAQVD